MSSQYTKRLEKIEAVLRENIPQNFQPDWIQNVYGDLPQVLLSEHLEHVAAPCRALLLLGGKRWRPLLLVLCAELADPSPAVRDAACRLTPVVEFIHTASLIHDDIEDGADMRRGKPAAHITYGTDTAINAGSWLFFQAFACLDAANMPDALKNRLYRLVHTEARRLHLGQSLDIYWHSCGNLLPTRAEYQAMVRLKTGTLASLAAQTGFLSAGGDESRAAFLGSAAADIGVGFQVLDDVLNLTTGNAGKKRGDDIVEGKKSLPVLAHLEQNPGDARLLAELFAAARSGGIDSPEVERAIRILTESGAVEQARLYASQLIRNACGRLSAEFAKNPVTELITNLFINMI